MNPCDYPECSTPSLLTCSGCSHTHYCSHQHQKQHWSQHKAQCRPYIIKQNKVFGRYIIAARDLDAGTIVLSESPLVVGPKRITLPVCLGCHKNVDCSVRCTRCGWPVCGQLCEKVFLKQDPGFVVVEDG